jgi:hypothetical protein
VSSHAHTYALGCILAPLRGSGAARLFPIDASGCDKVWELVYQLAWRLKLTSLGDATLAHAAPEASTASLAEAVRSTSPEVLAEAASDPALTEDLAPGSFEAK